MSRQSHLPPQRELIFQIEDKNTVLTQLRQPDHTLCTESQRALITTVGRLARTDHAIAIPTICDDTPTCSDSSQTMSFVLAIHNTGDVSQKGEVKVVRVAADHELAVSTGCTDLGFGEVDLTPRTSAAEAGSAVEWWWTEERSRWSCVEVDWDA